MFFNGNVLLNGLSENIKSHCREANPGFPHAKRRRWPLHHGGSYTGEAKNCLFKLSFHFLGILTFVSTPRVLGGPASPLEPPSWAPGGQKMHFWPKFKPILSFFACFGISNHITMTLAHSSLVYNINYATRHSLAQFVGTICWITRAKNNQKNHSFASLTRWFFLDYFFGTCDSTHCANSLRQLMTSVIISIIHSWWVR